MEGAGGMPPPRWSEIMVTTDSNIAYWPYTHRPETVYSVLRWSLITLIISYDAAHYHNIRLQNPEACSLNHFSAQLVELAV